MRVLLILVSMASVTGLAGCSTLPKAGPPPQSNYRAQFDEEIIAYVERRAVLSGAQVHWVNPPRKRPD